MPEGSEIRPRGWRQDGDLRCPTAVAICGDSRLLSDGSIDYVLYEARARRLRQEVLAEAGAALAPLLLRGLTTLAEWIAAFGDRQAPDIKPER
jgi:hypothetical protein